ncbi:hypothetical protein ASE12_09305 [Aeromicrobium sp. Root236]|uniref:FtsX-like permease family protein n=1 Tax=Aeromicrobium sp. Root236 TaxID=1736498 RepID=UPI0006F60FA6|nr:FtsX-like permease family protein [Aeromicrobium sp. Root236]KRC64939.1 hypothetical protein ASE12_09305 [Aeromicrobium sp. Root236]
MIADIRLGLRLARGGGAGGRVRGAANVMAQLIGSWVVLTMLAIIRAELENLSYRDADSERLILAVVATVGVPVVVLVATAGRLSAVLRDRRLAGLRTLGLSRSRTRLVAAVEAGAGGFVGCLLGLVAFWITRPAIHGLRVGGRDWSSSAFAPWPLAAALVMIGLPLVAVVVALIPGAHATAHPGSRAIALSAAKKPSPWRAALLVAGFLAVVVSTVHGSGSGGEVARRWTDLFIAGGVLCALGLVLVVPVFTRLIADILVRVQGRPSLRIAGRRLQTQPAGVSRIVAGLLIGLFVVAGGRMIVGSWEDTTQYRDADRAIHQGPLRYDVEAYGATRDDLAVAFSSLDGVVGAYVDRGVHTKCTGDGGSPCLEGFVGTCRDLKAAIPDATGCRDDRVAWLAAANADNTLGRSIQWYGPGPEDQAGPTERTPVPSSDAIITSKASPYSVVSAMNAEVFIPIGTPGMKALADAERENTQFGTVVQVDPNKLSASQVRAALHVIDPRAESYADQSSEFYATLNFVAGLRALVWGVAAVVLAIGLLGFAIATVDRSVARRAEMVSLQLAGTPRRVIRAAQWWEAGLPLLVGVALAVGAGTAVGAALLVLGDSYDAAPWGSVLWLGAVSFVAAIGIAGVTVAACAPRIRAELIRRA